MRVLVVGASHQGEVVVDILRTLPGVVAVGIVDAGHERRFVGGEVGGVPVVATLAELATCARDADGAVPAVGNCREREAVAARIEDCGLPLVTAIHASAVLASSVQVGAGSVVAAGAVLAVGAGLGRGCIVNTGAIIDHHCRVGDYAHVAPGACLAGGVEVGRRAWVGIGAVVREDLHVGDDAVVGAGAVVIRDVPAATTVVGVPARPLQRATLDS